MSSFQRETKLGMAVFIELLLELYRASSCPRALIRLFAYEKNAKYLRVALRIAMLIGSGYEDELALLTWLGKGGQPKP